MYSIYLFFYLNIYILKGEIYDLNINVGILKNIIQF